MTDLSISRLIRSEVNLTPLAARYANINTLLILGSSDVISVAERMRAYNALTDIAQDFGMSAPEYHAAALYFGQTPQPGQVFLGRWVETATHGKLLGGSMTTAQQSLDHWTSITDGALSITVDGVSKNVTGLDFSAATNLNGVASMIDAALEGAGIAFDGTRFTVSSASRGPESSVGYAGPASVGTDISGRLHLTEPSGAAIVAGFAAESAASAAALFEDRFGQRWYALLFADTSLTIPQHLAVAEFIQGTNTNHIYGITTTNDDVLDATVDDDIASQLKARSYTRTFVQYSKNRYAVASFLGRALTVNFEASKSTLTMMYKTEPGVVAEHLTSTQANTLEAKRCNVFVGYNNDTAILQHGVMSGPAWFDEIHGLDWLSGRIQTDVYNALYTSPTKIPQTDAGNHLLATIIEAACAQGVRNGLLAPGVWNSAGFGEIEQGDFLPKGYYIHQPPIALQPV